MNRFRKTGTYFKSEADLGVASIISSPDAIIDPPVNDYGEDDYQREDYGREQEYEGGEEFLDLEQE